MNEDLDTLERLERIKGHFDPKYIFNKKLFNEDFDTIEKELEILDIIKRSPFVLERIFELDNKRQEYKKRYWYGTISDTELNKVKEWLTQK